MAEEKPAPAAQLPAPSPSWDTLVHVEQLLTRFRFECEEFGLWPGAAGIRDLREHTGALGLIWELQRCQRILIECERQQRKPLAIHHEGKPTGSVLFDPPTEVTTRRWLPFWSVEIVHIFRSLSALTSLVLSHWNQEKLQSSGVVGGQLMGYEHAENEELSSDNNEKAEDGNFISGSHCLWVHKDFYGNENFVLPVDLTASIERCTARLRTVLAAGPIEKLIWYHQEPPPVIFVEVPKSHGRPPKCDREALLQELIRLRAKDVEWKDIPQHILNIFNAKYKRKTLETYYKSIPHDRRAG